MKTSLSCKTLVLLLGTIFLILWSFTPLPADDKDEESPMARIVGVRAGQIVNGDYFALGPLVVVSGTVNGDVYAVAGQVVIDGTVNGDVLVAGGRVSISGNVSQDARIFGGQVSLNGTVGGNLTVLGGNVEATRSAVIEGSLVSAGGNIHLAAPVGRSARAAAVSLILSNRTGRDVDALVGSLHVTSRAEIGGSLSYMSRGEASVEDGARIHGKLIRRAPRRIPWPSPEKLLVFLAGVSFLSTLILGLLSLRFLPEYHTSAVTLLREKPGASVAIGFVATIVTPVVCGLLLVTLFAMPLGLILAASYLILLYWGRIFAISRLGEAILGWFRASFRPAWTFVLGLVVYFLLTLIPFVGWVVAILIVLFGLGAELATRRNIYLASRKQGIL